MWEGAWHVRVRLWNGTFLTMCTHRAVVLVDVPRRCEVPPRWADLGTSAVSVAVDCYQLERFVLAVTATVAGDALILVLGVLSSEAL